MCCFQKQGLCISVHAHSVNRHVINRCTKLIVVAGDLDVNILSYLSYLRKFPLFNLMSSKLNVQFPKFNVKPAKFNLKSPD